MPSSQAQLGHLAELNAAQNVRVRQLYQAMGHLRKARLLLRLTQSLPLDGIKLEGQPAAERIDQVAELLHHYTAQLRRQADALTE